MLVYGKSGAGEESAHDVIFPGLVKRLQGPAATLPERLGLVAPGFGVYGCLGTQLIREICARQTNPTPRACLSHGTERRVPSDQSWWEQMLLAEQQLHSDPVHTLPVCSGLHRGYYVPNRAMIAPPSHPCRHSLGRAYRCSPSCLPLGSHCFFQKVQIVG